jgi:dTDP-4-dehydrorhamnose reductase
VNVPKRRIAVIGRNGQVARSLYEVLSPDHEVTQIARPEADLCDIRAIQSAILAARPDIVINPAAYTAVDRAEDEPDTAKAVNARGAEAVARAAANAGVPIIHFSTDYVFDGWKGTPYVETDATNPLSVYGQSKLEGEHRVASANPRHVILRTAWICSPYGTNFVRTILRSAKERPALNVVDDQRGTPTFAADVAQAVQAIVTGLMNSPEDHNLFGIFHVASRGETTWFHFARAIMDGAARRGGPHVSVHPIKTKDYPAKAHRPAYSVLSTEKIDRVHGIALPNWNEALGHCLDQLIGCNDDMCKDVGNSGAPA